MTDALTPQQLWLSDPLVPEWKTAAAARWAGAAISVAGELYTWGYNLSGQLGRGSTSATAYHLIPTKVGSDTDWEEVSCGEDWMLARKTNGTIWSWGSGTSFRSGQNTTGIITVPTQIGSDTDWASISAGAAQGFAIKNNGTLWGWGLSNSNGSSASNVAVPTQLGVATDWVKVFGMVRGGFAINTATELYSWGENAAGLTGQGSTSGVTLAPTLVTTNDIMTTGWSSVGPSNAVTYFNPPTTCSVGGIRDGQLYVWGGGGTSALAGIPGLPLLVPTAYNSVSTDPVFFKAADQCSYIVQARENALSAGSNTQGQTGQGTSSGTSSSYTEISPTNINAPHPIVYIDAGEFWALALTNRPVLSFASYSSAADGLNSQVTYNAYSTEQAVFSETLTSQAFINQSISSAASFVEVLETHLEHLLRSRFQTKDTLTRVASIFISHSSASSLRDRANFSHLVALASSINLEATGQVDSIRMLNLFSRFAVDEELLSSADYNVYLAAALAFSSYLNLGIALDFVSSAEISETLDAWYQAVTDVLSHAVTQTQLHAHKTVSLALSSHTFIEDGTESTAVLLNALASSLFSTVYVQLGSDVFEAWVLSEGGGYSQYDNYPFESIVSWKGKAYGLTPQTLYLLEGETDAGAPISAAIKTGLASLGTKGLKDAKAVYIGYTSTGKLVLKVTTTSGGQKREDWYALKQDGAEAFRTGRAVIQRGLRSTFWQFEICNQEGADFEIEDVTIVYNLLARRIRK